MLKIAVVDKLTLVWLWCPLPEESRAHLILPETTIIYLHFCRW